MLNADAITTDQNRRISETIAHDQMKLRRFIRKHVADDGEAEDIFQEVFYELIDAYRLMKPVERVGAWLFRVARNRIVDLFRSKRPAVLGNDVISTNGGQGGQQWEDLLPSRDAGPEAAYARSVLLEQLDAALEELPEEQRDVLSPMRSTGAALRN